MGKFNIYEAIYETNKIAKVDDKKIIGKTKPIVLKTYVEVLESVRESISKNHGSELANNIGLADGIPLLKTLISKYIHLNNLRCSEMDDFNQLVEKIADDMAGFGFLTKYIYDENVEEINCNGFDDIEVITTTGIIKLDEHFHSPQQCMDITKKMCALGGAVIDGSEPIKDSFITSGTRISAIIPPCIDEEVGAVFSIRKQKMRSITKDELINWNTATAEELEFLTLCLSCGVSVAIAGSTGSGKTTDISFLLQNIPIDKRIYSIEDSRELNLKIRDENGKVLNRVIHTKTRPSEHKRSDVTANELLKKSLRFDPDIIVPAEMRGEEAMTSQEAGRTGHCIITSLHASTALAAYTRILTMCMMSGTRLSEELMMKLIIEAFPIMAFKQQLPDKSRKFMRIIEAEDYKNGEIIYRTLYKFAITGREMSTDGRKIQKMIGQHRKENHISENLADKLLENGADISDIKRFASGKWGVSNV